MPGNLELLKADIRHELTQLKQLVKEFQSVTEKLKHEEIPTYDRGTIGYYLHNFYNGCRPRLIDDQLYPLLTDMKKTVEWYLQNEKW